MTVQVSAIGRLGVATETTFNTALAEPAFLDLPVVRIADAERVAALSARQRAGRRKQSGPR